MISENCIFLIPICISLKTEKIGRLCLRQTFPKNHNQISREPLPPHGPLVRCTHLCSGIKHPTNQKDRPTVPLSNIYQSITARLSKILATHMHMDHHTMNTHTILPGSPSRLLAWSSTSAPAAWGFLEDLVGRVARGRIRALRRTLC